jgi:peptidoglycan/LPS O-acetylase OafA/YrhL
MGLSFLHSLRRHTSTGLYIPELDGLRFVAIACVYVFHLAGAYAETHGGKEAPFYLQLASRLHIGVPLFFVISGLILGLPFARFRLKGGNRISLKRYFLRRLTRLEPPYVISLLLIFTMECLSRGGTWARIPHLGASLLYLHNLIFRDVSSVNPVAWSLEVEVQFYLVAPLLALVFAIRAAWLRRSLMLAAVALGAIAVPWEDMSDARDHAVAHNLTWMAHLSVAGNLPYFLGGFLLAELFVLLPPGEYRSRAWDAVSLAGWPALAYALVHFTQFTFTALPAIILLLYVAAFYGTVSRTVFGNLWIATIGGMCYSFYLLHSYATAALSFATSRIGTKLPFELWLGIQAITITPFILIFTIVYYRLIERPCMRPDWPASLKACLVRFIDRHRKPASA